MELPYIDDQIFNSIQFSQDPLEKGRYESCDFVNCDLSYHNLSEYQFIDCSFTTCNLTMVKLINSVLHQIKFKESKLVGTHFENCVAFNLNLSFENCLMQQASFYQLKLKGTFFKNTDLTEADFTEADLSGSVFDNCNLSNAVFEHTVLEKADFRTSRHYSINPELNRIKKAKFSKEGLAGLLRQYNIEIEE